MNPDPTPTDSIVAAADAIRSADALLIGAGAGMGVDSGLPDFRGPEGFWKAYPPFRGRQFAEMSNPHWFRADPALAWGFFGHRLNLYRSATPHSGFSILRRWAEKTPLGAFVFTSNVDGQFQKAGFDAADVLECHGSIRYLQCTTPCRPDVWSSDAVEMDVDMTTIRTRSEMPTCPSCRALARPNILMFGDWEWSQARVNEQLANYRAWLARTHGRRIVAIELGAGLAIPTVREECESRGQPLIRINPREPDTDDGISLPMGALDALTRIDAILQA
jgi:NAD-dependent SIR2 family protein deacetylase